MKRLNVTEIFNSVQFKRCKKIPVRSQFPQTAGHMILLFRQKIFVGTKDPDPVKNRDPQESPLLRVLFEKIFDSGQNAIPGPAFCCCCGITGCGQGVFIPFDIRRNRKIFLIRLRMFDPFRRIIDISSSPGPVDVMHENKFCSAYVSVFMDELQIFQNRFIVVIPVQKDHFCNLFPPEELIGSFPEKFKSRFCFGSERKCDFCRIDSDQFSVPVFDVIQ